MDVARALMMVAVMCLASLSGCFGEDGPNGEISEGDLLCFDNAGAYCFTMASNYNSRYRPAEVLWHKGQAHLIREREVFEDLLRHQCDPKIDFKALNGKKKAEAKA